MLKKVRDFLDELGYRGYHALIWTFIISLYITTGETENINHIFLWFTGVLMMLGLLITMYAKSTVSNKRSFEFQSVNEKRIDLVQCFILIIIGFLLMIVIKQLYIVFIGNETMANDELIKEHIGLFIPFYITSCIIAPIFEEIIFRGYGYMAISSLSNAICNRFKIQRYERRITVITFILVPALIFGYIHKQSSIFSLLTYVFAGIVFSLLFIITKRIWVSILAHFVNNSYAALQMVYVEQTNSGNEWVAIGYLSVVVLLVVILYRLYPNIKGLILKYDRRYSKT
ncbi:CPBP family intramembrane glutamic endopeptidase [Staphylococcus equorum]|uniref:CPBP family intramembrane glutamic endopeptidase n=1 Tax=Staphylococcus equorum TaxID=246432 RepID=UPI0018687E50|nr:CPBP family intramembrane glutamic endopeptidase [Staphylococcus equorum]